MKQIRIGTRGSELALIQARWVADSLEQLEPGVRTDIIPIKTKGDTLTLDRLPVRGHTGLFTRAIEDALMQDEVDVAVHSLKDLPTLQPEGLAVTAVPKRLDPHDVLVSRPGLSLDQLDKGARIGTSSVRRRAQLLAMDGDLDVVPLRGNIDTRLRRLHDGDFDAICLAKAGLVRMQRRDVATEDIPFDIMLPAAGQGALAVEVRQDNAAVLELVSKLNDERSAVTTWAEREVLKRLEAGCQVPVGVLGEALTDRNLNLRAVVCSTDGRSIVRAASAGTDAKGVVDELVSQLIEQDAKELIKSLRRDEQ